MLPASVYSMEPGQLAAAVRGHDEDRREGYRQAVYPVFLRHGKKGKRFDAFLKELGLGYDNPKASRKPKRDLKAAYGAAAHIAAKNRGR